jgi:hypothetical protein
VKHSSRAHLSIGSLWIRWPPPTQSSIPTSGRPRNVVDFERTKPIQFRQATASLKNKRLVEYIAAKYKLFDNPCAVRSTKVFRKQDIVTVPPTRVTSVSPEFGGYRGRYKIEGRRRIGGIVKFPNVEIGIQERRYTKGIYRRRSSR